MSAAATLITVSVTLARSSAAITSPTYASTALWSPVPPHLRPQKASDITGFLDKFSYSYDPADSVGIDCTPFNIYGAGEAAACQQQPVCCSNTNYVSLGPCFCSLTTFSNVVPRDLDWLHQYWLFSDGLQLGVVVSTVCSRKTFVISGMFGLALCVVFFYCKDRVFPSE